MIIIVIIVIIIIIIISIFISIIISISIIIIIIIIMIFVIIIIIIIGVGVAEEWFVRAVVLPRATGASIDDDHFKRRLCLSPYHEVKEISLSIQDTVGKQLRS